MLRQLGLGLPALSKYRSLCRCWSKENAQQIKTCSKGVKIGQISMGQTFVKWNNRCRSKFKDVFFLQWWWANFSKFQWQHCLLISSLYCGRPKKTFIWYPPLPNAPVCWKMAQKNQNYWPIHYGPPILSLTLYLQWGDRPKNWLGHNFWLEGSIDLRPTRLNSILQDTPLDHILLAQIHGQICH